MDLVFYNWREFYECTIFRIYSRWLLSSGFQLSLLISPILLFYSLSCILSFLHNTIFQSYFLLYLFIILIEFLILKGFWFSLLLQRESRVWRRVMINGIKCLFWVRIYPYWGIFWLLLFKVLNFNFQKFF